MPDPAAEIVESEVDQLSLHYEGGLADSGALLLNEYAESLAGWRDLFSLLGSLYFHSFPELEKVQGSDLLGVKIVAQRQGSFEAVVVFVIKAAAEGVIATAAGELSRWSWRKLRDWYQQSISRYIQRKSQTTNVTELVVTLRIVSEESDIQLESGTIPQEMEPMLEDSGDERFDQKDSQEVPSPVNKTQMIVEKMDHALKQATQPLERSCERIRVLMPDGQVFLEIGQTERDAIVQPLTLPPPNKLWFQARIRFIRINRETGRALFYFDKDDVHGHGSHFSRIIDPAVRKPQNQYTQAFNNDEYLEVWIRQIPPERGRLNLLWEISIPDPNENKGTLWDTPT